MVSQSPSASKIIIQKWWSRQSIVRSLKGAAADMVRYMGQTASVSNILQKLTVIFRMVTSFDVLMQNFYKVMQGNHEKVSSFATRLEGTLNQIQLKCPRWIADCEVSWHLKDCLFHGVWKHIRDSIWYLYSNPMTTYSEFMVAAQEEVWDKVRAKSAMVMELIDDSTELSNQTARLMAALTRPEQGNHPVSAPDSLRHWGHGRGRTDRNTPNCPSSHNGQIGLGQTTSTHSTSVGHSQSAASMRAPDSKAQGSPGGMLCKKEPGSMQCFRCQGWGHMVWECATPAKSLNLVGGNWGNVAQPPPTATNSRHPAFPPWPQTTTDHPKRNTKERMIKSHPAPFLNPDPVAWLVGHSNEPPVIMHGQETTTSIDLGTQVSSISTKFCEDLALQIQPLGQLLELEGTGGAVIQYLGFVEVNLQILGIRNYNEDELLLVIPTTT